MDRQTARLVPEKDGHALATAIDELLRQPEQARCLGTNARDLVCRRHSWARVAEQFEQVYERALERRIQG
jgi:glycosyltransferase involved in cell wall biosynthesis